MESREESEIAIKKIVLDALKPRDLDLRELSARICSLNGVSEVEIEVREVDVKTETVKIIVRGSDICYDEVQEELSELGVAIRSLDGIVVYKK
ncbi:MAG: hypothetical protein DRJ52_01410 [Thermoprotei archaeon]|nr:MAG: hypothetical protein DRJ52_01410 [Thermoprotei archaeon]RLF00140.1 MAG: hypothetical protein DRJ63_03230 [Thermoprotei archaeon]HDH06798.1 hypothetical protein [Thermoproteales archaeon]